MNCNLNHQPQDFLTYFVRPYQQGNPSSSTFFCLFDIIFENSNVIDNGLKLVASRQKNIL